MACISQNVSSITRLIANAFTHHHPSPSRQHYSSLTRTTRISINCLHQVGTSSSRSFSSASRNIARSISTNSFYETSCVSYAHHHRSSHYSQSACKPFTKLYSTTNNNELTAFTPTNNNDIKIDPYSDEAKSNLLNYYNHHNMPYDDDDITSVHDKLLRLTEQVLDWNQKLNLVSRKDCTPEVIYHRHVLPSIALLPLILEKQQQSTDSDILNVIDVGTGGGFPGLPLALLLPNVQFTLVDSVQKKLVAVSEMAADLDITNIRIHWGRVEEMYVGTKGRNEHLNKYDVVLGRSVTALPRFCGWVSDLLKRDHDGGRLIYIIGGELDDIVTSRIVKDVPLDTLLQREVGTSDKRALIFNANDVEEIGVESGEKSRIVRSSGPSKKTKNNNSGRGGGRGGGGKKLAKGAWSKKQNDVKKDRGYDDFQRYEG